MEDPKPEILARAALFVALRDQASSNVPALKRTPWTSLPSRRFGGDAYERNITLQSDAGNDAPSTVHVRSIGPDRFDITVHSSSGMTTLFPSTPAQLVNETTLSTTLNSEYTHTTVISQAPPPHLPASKSHSTMERLHIFSDGHKTSLVLPSPEWLLSLGGDLLKAGAGALKAPMPSLVVDVKVNIGDRVEIGQAVVVLESMKTETVLRSDISGIVKAVECKKGEMVAEGKELVDIEADEVEASS